MAHENTVNELSWETEHVTLRQSFSYKFSRYYVTVQSFSVTIKYSANQVLFFTNS